MATTTRITPSAKRNLKRVQAALEKRRGRTVTQEEVLEALLHRAAREPDAVAARIDLDQPNFTPADLARMRRHQFSTAEVTREEDIDLVLYGWKKERRRNGRAS